MVISGKNEVWVCLFVLVGFHQRIFMQLCAVLTVDSSGETDEQHNSQEA
jgi:hypothetical protein